MNDLATVTQTLQELQSANAAMAHFHMVGKCGHDSCRASHSFVTCCCAFGVTKAVHEAEHGDNALIDLLSHHLEQCDEAKQILRDKGYGCIGMDMVKTCDEVRPAID